MGCNLIMDLALRNGFYPATSAQIRFVYLISTFAPAASTFFLISSASCLATPSLIVLGAPSERFRLRKAESRNRAPHLFDHCNLVCTHFCQDHVKCGLFLGRWSCCSGRCPRLVPPQLLLAPRR